MIVSRSRPCGAKSSRRSLQSFASSLTSLLSVLSSNRLRLFGQKGKQACQKLLSALNCKVYSNYIVKRFFGKYRHQISNYLISCFFLLNIHIAATLRSSPAAAAINSPLYGIGSPGHIIRNAPAIRSRADTSAAHSNMA